jgi:hypothetical protein
MILVSQYLTSSNENYVYSPKGTGYHTNLWDFPKLHHAIYAESPRISLAISTTYPYYWSRKSLWADRSFPATYRR